MVVTISFEHILEDIKAHSQLAISDAIRDAEVNKHMVNGLDGRYMSGEGT